MPAPLLLAPLVLPALKAAIAASLSVAAKMAIDELRNSRRVEHQIEGLRVYFRYSVAETDIDIAKFDTEKLPPIARNVYYELSSKLEGISHVDLVEVKLCVWRAFEDIRRSHKDDKNITLEDVEYSH